LSDEQKWVASWTTPISWPYKPEPGAESKLVDGTAHDQTFRIIVRPDLWGDTIRVRLSNLFGTRDLEVSAVTVGLQEAGAAITPGTLVSLTFGGSRRVVLPPGSQVFSDPIHLPFVTSTSKPWLNGRNLAISFAIPGQGDALSVHYAPVYSYFSNPKSGDATLDEDGGSFPNITRAVVAVSELDVLADARTIVVCALGDSITDGGTTISGYDGWSEVLSRRAHKLYGDRISIVNMGVSANTVVSESDDEEFRYNEPVTKRLERDVLEISGLTWVIWLEGINDLGYGQNTPEAVIEGYKDVLKRLHQRGVLVIGATVTSSLWPEPNYDRVQKTHPKALVELLPKYGNPQVNRYREQINEFIRTSGAFDGVADMAAITEDPATGALYSDFQSGDYLHLNRAGHHAMASAVDITVLDRTMAVKSPTEERRSQPGTSTSRGRPQSA